MYKNQTFLLLKAWGAESMCGGATAAAEEPKNWLSKKKNIDKSFIKKIPLSPQTSEV